MKTDTKDLYRWMSSLPNIIRNTRIQWIGTVSGALINLIKGLTLIGFKFVIIRNVCMHFVSSVAFISTLHCFSESFDSRSKVQVPCLISDSKLTFLPLFCYIRINCNNRWTFSKFSPIRTRMILYLCYVRTLFSPKLDYVCIIYDSVKSFRLRDSNHHDGLLRWRTCMLQPLSCQ